MSNHREKIAHLLSLLRLTNKISFQFRSAVEVTEELVKKNMIKGSFSLTDLEKISDTIVDNYRNSAEEFLIDEFAEKWNENQIDEMILIFEGNPLIKALFLKVGKMGANAHNNALKKVRPGISGVGIKLKNSPEPESKKPSGYGDPERKLNLID